MTQTAFFSRRVYPCQMSESAVRGDADHLRIQRMKLGGSVAERYDLGGANKCKIKWIKQ